MNIVIESRELEPDEHIPFKLIVDRMGKTALHYCVEMSLTNAAEDILQMIGMNQLGDHSHYINELFPELIDVCPIAFTKYLSDRMIKCPW